MYFFSDFDFFYLTHFLDEIKKKKLNTLTNPEIMKNNICTQSIQVQNFSQNFSGLLVPWNPKYMSWSTYIYNDIHLEVSLIILHFIFFIPNLSFSH